MPTPYDVARAAARRREGQLTAAQLLEIRRAVERYAEGVAGEIRRLGSLPGSRGLQSLQVLLEKQSRALGRLLESSISKNRAASFNETLRIWDQAGIDYARFKGVDPEELAALRPPPVTMLGAYETLSPAGTWKTLLVGYSENAAAEANAIVRNGIASQVGPDELARRLRKYVTGSETFQQAFSNIPTLTGEVAKLDLRTIPTSARGAARSMVYNAERIAFSELHNARAEAEVQHFLVDPFIVGVKWTLSPNRGTLDDADECDYLASTDFYGMGAGVYPVGSVPSPPHPFDRCERVPVTRATSEIAKPKPSPARRLDPMTAPFPQAGTISKGAVNRARASAVQAMANAESGRPE